MLRFWPWASAILTGLLLTLCYPRIDQGWLCWIALVPLIAAVWLGASDANGNTQPRLKRAALLGYVAGLVFFWGVFSWLTTVTWAGWFLLSFYLALFPAVWAVFLALGRRVAGDFTRSGANLALAITGAAAWVALEWLRGLGAISFGWDGLGIALHKQLPLIQIAEFTGVAGVSFLVALVNLIVAITICRVFNEFRARRMRPHWDFNICIALVAATFAFGARRVLAPPEFFGIPLRVAAVQANIPHDPTSNPPAELVKARYTKWTETALATRPQLLLWPEAATPGYLFESQEMFDYVRGFVAERKINFLLGSLDSDDNRHDYNIAALFTQADKMPQIYRKIHLVPFGEYIPFRHTFPPFEWIIGRLVPGDFTSGTEYTMLQLEQPEIKAAALICFEDTLGDLTRRFVKRGAQLLINVTNDGWFLQSQGCEQHLANAVFRAVENRRPLVRSANTGVTAFIDPLGRVTRSLRPDGAPFGEGVLEGEIRVPPADSPQTFYTRHGEVFSQACALLSLVALFSLVRQNRNK